MDTHPLRLRRNLLLAALGAPLLLRSRGLLAATRCPVSATSVLGPAYRSDAPFRSALCGPAEPGTALRMTGTISAAETCDRLAGAVLDVWQVSAAGEYDLESPDFHLRGRLKSDKSGWYRFDSVVPAPYGRRAQHIHYLVTCPGYEPHITQSFFRGDERLKTDPLAKAALVVDLRNLKDRKLGKFDIVMRREQPADAAAVAAWPDFAGTYEVTPKVTLKIAVAGDHLQWKLSEPDEPGEPLDGRLYPRAANRFFCPEYDLTSTFVREDGRVTHMLVNDKQLAKKIA